MNYNTSSSRLKLSIEKADAPHCISVKPVNLLNFPRFFESELEEIGKIQNQTESLESS